MVNTAMVGGVVNRNNILYYPLILCAAYALWQMGRRLKTALAAMVVMVAIGFAGHVRHLFRRCGLSICDGQLFPERIAGSAGRNVGLGLRSILSDDDGSQRRTKGDDGAGHVCPSYRLRHARGGGGSFAAGTESRTDGTSRNGMCFRISAILNPIRWNVPSILSASRKKRCLTRRII